MGSRRTRPLLDAGGGTPGRSPARRSASVGRRVQEVAELASVVQELSSKGRVIQSISSALHDPIPGFQSRHVDHTHHTHHSQQREPNGGPSVSAAPGPARAEVGADRGARGGSSAAAIYRSLGGAGPPPGPGSGGHAARPGSASGHRSGGVGGGSTGPHGGGSAAGGGGGGGGSTKGVSGRSILGGIETLTSKLELLDRLTPKKTSPRPDYNGSSYEPTGGRRGTGGGSAYGPGATGGGGGGPNFRDLLAAANAGLLQSQVQQDTVLGGRDQRPSVPGPAPGPTAPASHGLAYSAAALRAPSGGGATGFGGAAGGGAGVGSQAGVAAATAELAASMILQNRRRTSEDLAAADRVLQSLHAEIRGAAGAAGMGGGGDAYRGDAARNASATARGEPPGREGPGAAANQGSYRSGGGLNGALALAPAPAAEGSLTEYTRRRGNNGAGGMLSSFLASLGEAVPPPQTPVTSNPGGPDPTPARPVVAPEPSHRERETAVASASYRAPPPPQQQSPYELPTYERSYERYSAGADNGGAGSRPVSGQASSGAPLVRAIEASAGGASSALLSVGGVAALTTQLGPKLSEVQRLTQHITRGFGLEPESSGGSLGGAGGGGGGWSGGGGVVTAAAAAAGPARYGTGAGLAQSAARGLQPALTAAANTAAGSSLTLGRERSGANGRGDASASVSGSSAGGGQAPQRPQQRSGLVGDNGSTNGYPSTAVQRPSSALNADLDSRRHSSSNGGVGGEPLGVGLAGSSGPLFQAPGGENARLGSGLGLGLGPGPGSSGPGPVAGSAGAVAGGGSGAAGGQEAEGLHMRLLREQRRKEAAWRDEAEAAGAAAAAGRARAQAADQQESYDALWTKYLATRERLEVLEEQVQRVAVEGCRGCGANRDAAQRASDAAANAAAQLREVQSQMQEARTREEALRRQLDAASSAASDKAAAGTQLQMNLLQDLLELAAAAADASSVPGLTSGRSPRQGSGGGAGGRNSHSGGGAASASAGDVDGMLTVLQERLREQAELARRQRELLETAQDQAGTGLGGQGSWQ
ncbi:hypothetical protein HYH03_007226 [Edaphochlamys debaryana]|uniref:Uncharacterized protein n=1 Tax=Edaphochlamys debaryana TaxID=47281 RepID=A0A836C088_9CHLO|nr:hypothetical protein HYH03_007226 [Edaphochlamys debaryana]|eukprot:KAG2494712.1 hypothetical protein HYH03_007226 [Edaphochlamys debaryana]